MILSQVKGYLSAVANDQEFAEMSEEDIQAAGEAVKASLRRHFGADRKPRKHTLRMSSLGSPLCQQQMALSDAPSEPNPYNMIMRFVFGDAVEAIAFAIMRAAGVDVQNEQESVSVDVAGETIDGTLDCEIDGKVYDVKSTSDHAFKNKFTDFKTVYDTDTFGYAMQGYLYAEAKGKPFGGWITINKNSGEWNVVDTPIVDASYRKALLSQAAHNVKNARNMEAFERCFEPEDETWYKKPTGRKTLAYTCTYCKYKDTCWGGDVAYLPNPKSKADNPPKRWYFKSTYGEEVSE